MANKAVTTPCSYTGTVEDDAHPFWTYPDSNKVTTLCPECNSVVAINKSSRKLRRHNGISAAGRDTTERHLVYDFE
jgi:hypothetical protein